MGLLLLVVFVVTALAEFLVFNWLVQTLFDGALTIPIVLLVADSVFGALLVKQEGSKAWQRFRAHLSRGVAPPEQVVQGALILFGGALLLTPGFLTDIVGVLCVLGPTRTILAAVLLKRFAAASSLGSVLGGARGATTSGTPSARARKSRPRAAGPGKDRPGTDQPSDEVPPRDGGTRPPPPGVIDVEVVDVKRNKPKDADG